jgi:PAS domain S-box-containing protein
MSVDLERLVQKAEIWQLLFDECPIAVAVFTANMKFFLVNPAFTEMSGHSIDILVKDIKEVIPSRFRKLHRKVEKEYASKPEKKVNRHGLEPYLLKADGTEIKVDIDLSYIQYDAKVYYVAFIRRIV